MRTKLIWLLILPLTVLFTDCKKDDSIEQNNTNSSTGRKQTYAAEVKFSNLWLQIREVKKNGVELTGYTFQVETGDVIEVYADNECLNSTQGGGKDCPFFSSELLLDGIVKAEDNCTCESISYKYTIE